MIELMIQIDDKGGAKLGSKVPLPPLMLAGILMRLAVSLVEKCRAEEEAVRIIPARSSLVDRGGMA